MSEFHIGDHVRYKGARGSVFGREGMIRRTYRAHSAWMHEVDFGTEVYCCWAGNLDHVYEEVPVEFLDEVPTKPSKLPPPK